MNRKRVEINLKSGDIVNLSVGNDDTIAKTTEFVTDYDENDKRVKTRELVVKVGDYGKRIVCTDKREQTSVYKQVVKVIDELDKIDPHANTDSPEEMEARIGRRQKQDELEFAFGELGLECLGHLRTILAVASDEAGENKAQRQKEKDILKPITDQIGPAIEKLAPAIEQLAPKIVQIVELGAPVIEQSLKEFQTMLDKEKAAAEAREAAESEQAG